MERIRFVNRETVRRGQTQEGLRIVLIICAAVLTMAILVMVMIDGFKSVSLFAGFVMPAFLWTMALRKPTLQSVMIAVEEELERTEGGICLHIAQIDRGDKRGVHQEHIVYPRERMKGLLFHAQSGIVDVIGRPVFHFQSDKGTSIWDTIELDADYLIRIHCTVENHKEILQIVQEGFQRTAELRED